MTDRSEAMMRRRMEEEEKELLAGLMANPGRGRLMSANDDGEDDDEEEQAVRSLSRQAMKRKRRRTPSESFDGPLHRFKGIDHTRSARGDGANDHVGPRSSISVRAWDPSMPYMKSIRGDYSGQDSHKRQSSSSSSSSSSSARSHKEQCEEAYGRYLAQRIDYMKSPSFYFDVSSMFESTFDNKKLAVRILSNVLELNIDNVQLLRTVGYKLIELGLIEAATGVFEKVRRLNPHEPQSHRDLALLLLTKDSSTYNPDRGVQLLDHAISGDWDRRFFEIEMTCLMELGHALKAHGFDYEDLAQRVDLKTPKNMTTDFPVDLRISMAWDTDMTDVDLHVIEPGGEECYYRNKTTRMGGALSRDFTKGFGPEEYVLRVAQRGTYRIKAKYYANHQQSLTGATTLLLTIFKNYGDADKEEKKFISFRLASNKELMTVGEVSFP